MVRVRSWTLAVAGGEERCLGSALKALGMVSVRRVWASDRAVARKLGRDGRDVDGLREGCAGREEKGCGERRMSGDIDIVDCWLYLLILELEICKFH
jgi:hypothetical protein